MKRMEETIERLKRKYGLSGLGFTLGPDATPENVEEEFEKIYSQLLSGDYELVDDPPVTDRTKKEL